MQQFNVASFSIIYEKFPVNEFKYPIGALFKTIIQNIGYH